MRSAHGFVSNLRKRHRARDAPMLSRNKATNTAFFTEEVPAFGVWSAIAHSLPFAERINAICSFVCTDCIPVQQVYSTFPLPTSCPYTKISPHLYSFAYDRYKAEFQEYVAIVIVVVLSVVIVIIVVALLIIKLIT